MEPIVAVSSGPIKQVYLNRMIRQDKTGIRKVVADNLR